MYSDPIRCMIHFLLFVELATFWVTSGFARRCRWFLPCLAAVVLFVPLFSCGRLGYGVQLLVSTALILLSERLGPWMTVCSAIILCRELGVSQLGLEKATEESLWCSTKP